MEESISAVGKSHKRSTIQLTIGLLFFSLLPGAVKLFGAQFLFLLNIPVVLLLFFLKDQKAKCYKIDIVFFLFFLFVCAQTLVWTFLPFVNTLGLFMGFYMYIFPMVGFFLSRKFSLSVYLQALVVVCLVHAVIGIMIYPMFGLGKFLGDFASKLREGTGIIRMGSVSGSLGFGNLMLVGFISSLALKKMKLCFLFFFCIICSMQRSAWLSGIFSLLTAFILLFNIQKGLRMILAFFIACASFLFIFQNEFSETLFSRLGEVGSNAAGERSGQWNGGIENFFKYPFGSGAGQVGQVGTRYENNDNFNKVPDGDFFRILSETGLVGAIFYIFLFLLLVLCISNINNLSYNNKFMCILLFAYSIQMIGSNITEFYFTNFIYWIFIGFFFKNFRIVKSINE